MDDKTQNTPDYDDENALSAAERTHPCPVCGAPVSNERTELLGIEECINCTPQKGKPIGVFDYVVGSHERNEGIGKLLIVD